MVNLLYEVNSYVTKKPKEGAPKAHVHIYWAPRLILSAAKNIALTKSAAKMIDYGLKLDTQASENALLDAAVTVALVVSTLTLPTFTGLLNNSYQLTKLTIRLIVKLKKGGAANQDLLEISIKITRVTLGIIAFALPQLSLAYQVFKLIEVSSYTVFNLSHLKDTRTAYVALSTSIPTLFTFISVKEKFNF